MASMQRRSIRGTSLLRSPVQQRAIVLPLLPENGAWSITGTIFDVSPVIASLLPGGALSSAGLNPSR